MQPYKITRSKTNSKACDQCYRCKVKCTMELSGCERCRMTDGVCTYSLGKWMGRPKKSGQQTSQAKVRGARVAGSASPEHVGDFTDRIAHGPYAQQYWELLPSTMEDQIRSPLENAAISPFSMDDYAQFRAEGFYASTNESLSTTSSDKKQSPSPPSQHRILSREISQRDLEIISATSSQEFQRGNHHKQQDGSYPYLPTPQSLGSDHDFNFGNMGVDVAGSPQLSLAGTIETHTIDYTKVLDGQQTSPTAQEEPTSSEEQPHRCKCSQAALSCLDKISFVPPEAQYTHRIEVIQSALSTAEQLLLCTNCLPNMTIARCCFILGNAHELVSDMSSPPEDSTSPTTAASRQAIEHVRRVKRRATLLFAGLKTLQDIEPGGCGFSDMQAEFLVVMARAWGSLPKC